MRVPQRVPCVEAVAAVLASEGVDTVFGVPGTAAAPFYAALRAGGIEHLAVRHEESGAHAADGWARATGKVGVSVGTSGAAGTSVITGLCTALADSVPVVRITGQPPDRPADVLVDIVEIVRPATKWAVRVGDPAQVPWVLREAFRVARSGRPGPVLVDLPAHVQHGTCFYDPRLDAPLPVDVPAPPQQPVNAAVQLLLDAQRPIIIAGGGVVGGDASDELRQLAEHLQVPVQVTPLGTGAFPEDHPLYAGLAGLHPAAPGAPEHWGGTALLESDLVLAVGARFGDLGAYGHGRVLIHVDIEPTQVGRVFEAHLGIVGHARPTLAAMCAHARRASPPHAPGTWVERVTHLRTTQPADAASGDDDAPSLGAPRVLHEVDAAFGPDTAMLTGIGLHQAWPGALRRPRSPRHRVVCGRTGAPGWEVPAAIGVRSAFPRRQVVVVLDGGTRALLGEEVAVAARQGLPFVIVDLHRYHPAGGIDHIALMTAFGCPARRIDRPGELAGALGWAAATAESARLPVLVEVVLGSPPAAGTGVRSEAASLAE